LTLLRESPHTSSRHFLRARIHCEASSRGIVEEVGVPHHQASVLRFVIQPADRIDRAFDAGAVVAAPPGATPQREVVAVTTAKQAHELEGPGNSLAWGGSSASQQGTRSRGPPVTEEATQVIQRSKPQSQCNQGLMLHSRSKRRQIANRDAAW
jgi:hypothetical protein